MVVLHYEWTVKLTSAWTHRAEKNYELFSCFVPHITWPAFHLEAQLLFPATIPDISFLKGGMMFEAWAENPINILEAAGSHQRVQISEGYSAKRMDPAHFSGAQ